MGWSRRPAPLLLDELLAELPDGFGVVAIGPSRFVWGPTGAYVVLADDGRRDRPRQLSRLAATVRSALAERVALTPFVHPLLVAEQDRDSAHATTVPASLLVSVLTLGPTVLDGDACRHVAGATAAGALRGLEAVAPAPVADTMTGCSSTPVMGSASPSTTSEGPIGPSSGATPPASTEGSGGPSPAA